MSNLAGTVVRSCAILVIVAIFFFLLVHLSSYTGSQLVLIGVAGVSAFGILIALAAIIDHHGNVVHTPPPTSDSNEQVVRTLQIIQQQLMERHPQREATPSAPVVVKEEHPQADRMVHLLEEMREILLMTDGQRAERLRHYSERRKVAALAKIDQHLRREEWSQADELIGRLESEFPDEPEVRRVKIALESGRAEAENDALTRVRSNVEDLMAVASWDQAHASAEAFTQNFPHNQEGRDLLARVARERDVFRESAATRLYEQIKKDVDHRQWRKALAGAQRLLERFPDHPKANKTRQMVRTIQDNAEIEERQEQETKIQQLIKSKRFEEAVTMSEELIRRFPLSPQADAIEAMLPKLRDLAIQQEAGA